MKIISATFLQYGEEWRKHRRMIQQYFNTRAIIAYRPQQEHEVNSLLEDLRRDPKDFRRHVKRFTASMMLTAAYGYEVATIDDPYVGLVERTNHLIFAPGQPGSSMVDLFPFRE